ncbi:hypothetical protein CSC74_13245 [Pseudoxanthomonas yeongjuensis]|uniref:hypothetical protein n=1 Tax=Pseudoxanthomonas yeongjuensis TaxID=377616 RepID=UPI0013911FD3|nr:hypothetical protein [Pseudoxanthomonas yeongjuensis]KAF1715532.1 hypothetical protein CSC74_13245 [Pseudoxanthomonas yeongjuensis]
MRHLILSLLLTPLIACATPPMPPHAPVETASAALGGIAEAYVHLTLEAGEHEPGYVDAYYGPATWAEQAKAEKRSLPDLRAATDGLIQRAQAIDTGSLTALEIRRKKLLVAQLTAAATRMAMMAGEKPAFDDEAEGLYALRPVLKPLDDYDPALQRLEAVFPGDGPLWQRVDTFASTTAIAHDRLEQVMHASIDECKRRTLAHIALPADEKFTLELVTGQPWSGYNWYKGDATSVIQINTDLPVLMSRAVDLGCHEGYPGHHVLNMLLEQRLYRQRGWIEFTVYPLYSPMSLIAEGSANFGIELAFPGEEKLAFERDVLYPLAGLDPELAARDAQLQQARAELAGARLSIARDYLDGRIDRAEAVRLAQKYQLMSPQRAEQSIAFVDRYRSYVINYGLGQDLVRAHVDAAGKTPEARWTAMERILSEPTIPGDLLPGSGNK